MVSTPERRKFFGTRGNEEKKWAGIVILVVLGCLHLYTLGTWVTAFVRGNWPDRRRRVLDRAPLNKRIMQSSRRWKEEAGTLVGPRALAYLDESLGGLDRPRICDRDDCPSPELRLGDRMYCSTSAPWIFGHLPLYDHFCHVGYHSHSLFLFPRWRCRLRVSFLPYSPWSSLLLPPSPISRHRPVPYSRRLRSHQTTIPVLAIYSHVTSQY